jgi:hypothetical protein
MMALSAALLGDAEASVILAVVGMWSGEPGFVVLAPFSFTAGLFYALFVLPITVTAATLWYLSFRATVWLATRLHEQAGQAKGPGVAGA